MEVPLVYRQNWEDLITRVRSECICEIGVSSSLAINFFFKAEYSSDLCVHCYVKCITVKLNLMSSSTGEVIEHEFLRQVAGTTPSMISRCKNGTIALKDPCLIGYYMYQCIVSSLLVPV
ncbi:hypothetical protein RN001_000116 [Aquatica leii]|uniref:Uncharacterized protein n=1 Tax=Aquatica leii TaxID=1421715 RepID=A0AAN7SSD9_9COLE|nr:hypothetical protein RN001_000116 [Aquatica leii]